MSGQPFIHLLNEWHPRDVDTLQEIYRDRHEESSLQQQRAAIRAQGLGQT